MDLQECKIIIMAVIEDGSTIPSSMVITIAPSDEEAIELAKKELKKVGVDQNGLKIRLRAVDSILFPSIPITAFLYVPGPGVLK